MGHCARGHEARGDWRGASATAQGNPRRAPTARSSPTATGYAVAELETALATPQDLERGRILRRRQHHDAGRLDLLPGPRTGRPEVLHRPAICSASAFGSFASACSPPRMATTCPTLGRPRWRSWPGARWTELRALSEEIFDELMAERIWSGTHALARLHLDAGQRVWLVTAAPVELGAVIAQRLGLTGAIGTVAEISDGVYTGRLVGDLMHGPAKADAIADLAAQEGLDLSRCAAYSDSVNDLPMLSAVGRPVAVNPDAALRRAARDNGWEIRDFRTGRKAAKIAVPAALGAGVVAGAIAAAIALNRRGSFRALHRHGTLAGTRAIRRDL